MNETHVHVSSNDTWESMKRARKLYNTKIVVDDVSARGRGARLLRLRHCMSCASWWVECDQHDLSREKVVSLCDWLLAFRSSGGCVICRVACWQSL